MILLSYYKNLFSVLDPSRSSDLAQGVYEILIAQFTSALLKHTEFLT